MRDYVESSLELHLFYARIMKEHAFFLEVGFTKANESCEKDAKFFKEQFEDLLKKVICKSEGYIDRDVIDSGEAITGFTLCSEEKTMDLTGACLNTDITKMEEALASRCNRKVKCTDQTMIQYVRQLNEYSMKLLDNFIAFQKWLSNQVLCCNIATFNYPALIEHIIKEAEMYQSTLQCIECNMEMNFHDVFMLWLEGMKDHAALIRGLLDLVEEELFAEADTFVTTFSKVIEAARTLERYEACPLMSEIINDTMELRDYKAGATKGINDCLVRSVILPLLADHVLREANYFLRLLMNQD